MHQFLKSLPSIVATSPNYAKTSPVLQQYNHKVQVIPIGIEKDFYAKVNKERLDHWKRKQPFFLFIGVLRYYKGLHSLIESMKEKAPLEVVIAGEGPLEAELKKKAKRLQLKNVHFISPLSNEDKIALLQACYGYVFPSHLRTEAFGLSLLEAAMYGKPLISC